VTIQKKAKAKTKKTQKKKFQILENSSYCHNFLKMAQLFCPNVIRQEEDDDAN
jgi:hypothetical protein